MLARWLLLAPLLLVVPLTLVALLTPVILAAPPAQDIAQGRTLFTNLGCSGCHGDRAQGFIGPRLSGLSLTWDEFLRQARTPTGGTMPPYAASVVTDSQLLSIYAYLRDLGGLPLYPETTPSEVMPEPASEPPSEPAAES